MRTDARRAKQIESLRRLTSRAYERPLMWLILGFQAACMLLLSFKDGEVNLFSLLMSALLPLGSWAGLSLIRKWTPVDKVIYLLTMYLCSLSVIVLRAVFLSPEKAVTQATYLLPGFGALLIGIGVSRLGGHWWYRFLGTAGALGALMLLVWPFAYSTSSAARSWVRLGGRQFQPSELIKAASVYVLAALFGKGKRFGQWIWGILYGAAACGILLLQRDLGALLLYFLLTVAMFYAGTGKGWLTLSALAAAGAAGGIFVRYANEISGFHYLAERISIWQDPWNSTYENARQLVQGLMSIVSGGLFGAGLGLSSARKVAVVASDYIFAAVSEEFGMVFSLSILLTYLALMLRGLLCAASARSRFHALLAFGCTFEITSQMLLIVCGNLHLLPLTGVTLPLISEGGSSLFGSMLMMGTLLGVSSLNAQDEEDGIRLLESGRRSLP